MFRSCVLRVASQNFPFSLWVNGVTFGIWMASCFCLSLSWVLCWLGRAVLSHLCAGSQLAGGPAMESTWVVGGLGETVVLRIARFCYCTKDKELFSSPYCVSAGDQPEKPRGPSPVMYQWWQKRRLLLQSLVHLLHVSQDLVSFLFVKRILLFLLLLLLFEMGEEACSILGDWFTHCENLLFT